MLKNQSIPAARSSITLMLLVLKIWQYQGFIQDYQLLVLQEEEIRHVLFSIYTLEILGRENPPRGGGGGKSLCSPPSK